MLNPISTDSKPLLVVAEEIICPRKANDTHRNMPCPLKAQMQIAAWFPRGHAPILSVLHCGELLQSIADQMLASPASARFYFKPLEGIERVGVTVLTSNDDVVCVRSFCV